MRIRSLIKVTLLAALAGIFGCGESADPTEKKGAEEAELGDYEAAAKADSWRQPTEHGALTVGLASSGNLGPNALFHAWTFELTKDAKVTLSTAGGTNLDTVLYLYHRDVGATRWGRYIAKNDDYQGGVQSVIERTLKAGEYRAMVKGFKKALRGNFSLTLDCTGGGCPGIDDTPFEHPDETSYTKGCAEQLYKALTSRFVSAESFSIEIDDIKLLTGWNRAAVKSYVIDSSEWLDPDDLKEWGLEVDALYLDGGAVINVTEGGDYSMDYVFDADGELIMTYFNDQSPWPTWYCGIEGEPSLSEEEPEEFCAGSIVRDLIRDPQDDEEISGVAGDMSPFRAQHGAKVYRERSGLAAGVDVNYEGLDWAKSDFGSGSELTFTATGTDPVTYVIGGTDKWDTYVLFERAADRMHTLCSSAQ